MSKSLWISFRDKAAAKARWASRAYAIEAHRKLPEADFCNTNDHDTSISFSTSPAVPNGALPHRVGTVRTSNVVTPVARLTCCHHDPLPIALHHVNYLHHVYNTETQLLRVLRGKLFVGPFVSFVWPALKKGIPLF